MTDRKDIVERLRAAHAEIYEQVPHHILGMRNKYPEEIEGVGADEMLEAASTIEDLRAALEPFVTHLKEVEKGYDAEYVRFIADHVLLTNNLTWGQFRAARAALSKSRGET